jgi:2-keto-4-pentenoate hydratase/2-oxohepta-3-ene-1,7-dioic acid hydratase in catechol pathway
MIVAAPTRSLGQQDVGFASSQMVHDVYQQIEYLSTAFTLEPGDILATGTPEGVGVAMSPPRFLKVGDVLRSEVEGVGVIENRVIAER